MPLNSPDTFPIFSVSIPSAALPAPYASCCPCVAPASLAALAPPPKVLVPIAAMPPNGTSIPAAASSAICPPMIPASTANCPMEPRPSLAFSVNFFVSSSAMSARPFAFCAKFFAPRLSATVPSALETLPRYPAVAAPVASPTRSRTVCFPSAALIAFRWLSIRLTVSTSRSICACCRSLMSSSLSAGSLTAFSCWFCACPFFI